MVKFYRESPPSPIVLSHSTLRNMSSSPSDTLIRRQESHRSQRVHFPSSSPIYVAFDQEIHKFLVVPSHEEVEQTMPVPSHEEIEDTTRVPSRISQHDTAPWILASRTLHAPKKPEDTDFMAHMANIRRQIIDSDTSSTSSTPRVSLIVPHFSVSSSAFSQSLSITSLPPVVEFPPTPVFKDEIPEGIMRKIKSPPRYSSTNRRFI
jgi:hypothetical protein